MIPLITESKLKEQLNYMEFNIVTIDIGSTKKTIDIDKEKWNTLLCIYQ